jgi:hypothetical protein
MEEAPRPFGHDSNEPMRTAWLTARPISMCSCYFGICDRRCEPMRNECCYDTQLELLPSSDSDCIETSVRKDAHTTGNVPGCTVPQSGFMLMRIIATWVRRCSELRLSTCTLVMWDLQEKVMALNSGTVCYLLVLVVTCHRSRKSVRSTELSLPRTAPLH